MYTELFSLQHKSVVITGGSGYLGSALTEALLAFGADVTVADLNFPYQCDTGGRYGGRSSA